MKEILDKKPDIIIRKENDTPILIETDLNIPEAIYLLDLAKFHLLNIHSTKDGCRLSDIFIPSVE